MNNAPMLTIHVPTYGHEKYIRQALDSILMQKTDYAFEVLVGEDASPDRTKAILKEYETKYPGIFTMLYREKNMSNMVINNTFDLKLRSRGKYIICLEGDDFWTDENKIQQQIDFLETHPSYIAVAHNCQIVDADSMPTDRNYPECKHEEYTLWDYLIDVMPGHTTTVMYRNFFRTQELDFSLLGMNLIPGDRLLYFILAIHGKVHCIQKTMSAYRYITSQGQSFSASYKYNFGYSENWNRQLLDYGRKHNIKAELCAEVLYFSAILKGYKENAIQFRDILYYTKEINHKWLSIVFYLIRYIWRHAASRTI